ncbi:MAG: hypothetical protein RR286_03405 [Mucinivorans sp.]
MMRRIFIALLAMLPLVAVSQRVQKVAIAGSYCPRVVIVDKASGAIEWSYELTQEGSECNSVSVTKKGDVLISYKLGAQLIGRDGHVIWDYHRQNDKQEVQTAVPIKGGFMLGICGTPMKIVELSMDGKVTKELSYDLGVSDSHGQFRRMFKTKDGSYIVPLIGGASVLELSASGQKVNQFEVGGSPFAGSELKDGSLLISCGNRVAEFTRAGDFIRDIAGAIVGCDTMRFLTEAVRLDNGNTMVTNWQGHADNSNGAQIIELDEQGKVVWLFDNKKQLKYVSAVFPFMSK